MRGIVTIKKNHEFRRLYSKGKVYTAPALITYTAKNRLGVTRIGITTSKKIGGAVARNRARRVIREAYRLLRPEITPGRDLIFVARSRTTRVKSTEIYRVMKEQLKEAGVIVS